MDGVWEQVYIVVHSGIGWININEVKNLNINEWTFQLEVYRNIVNE